MFFSCQVLMKKFIALGTECTQYLKVAKASEGEFFVLSSLVLYAFSFFLFHLTSFSFLCWTADALASANARISSLEAELSASWKVFDAMTAAKASAEKLHKTALAKAKKVEKALADTNKEHLQREQAIAERLNMMSATAGGTYSSCPLLLSLLLSYSH
jgi:hypothetical protein